MQGGIAAVKTGGKGQGATAGYRPLAPHTALGDLPVVTITPLFDPRVPGPSRSLGARGAQQDCTGLCFASPTPESTLSLLPATCPSCPPPAQDEEEDYAEDELVAALLSLHQGGLPATASGRVTKPPTRFTE